MSLSSAAAGVPFDAGDAPAIDDASTAPSAMQLVFEACGAALHRYFAVRTGDMHLADDLMQQLWLAARGGGGAIPATRLEFWLRAVAKNLLRSHWRARRRRPEHVPMPDPELAVELAGRLVAHELPADELARREVRDQLLLALTELPAAEQELLIGCYFEQRSHAELAGRLGISERAVEGRLYRARQALREQLASVA
ncbi:MAG: hypothetical protein CHACPFDD_00083 [Phycisphaerae bacterium]|nr:hypothetical protein [Phycisphaerae bacterium]